MGKRYTPKFDGSNEVRKQVPKPPPGLYRGKVIDIALGVITGGKDENIGQDRISVGVEITEGKYTGARIYNNFNITKQGASYWNDFLLSLTDGTEEAGDKVIADFWKKKRMLVSENTDKYGNNPILRIGDYIFKNGVATNFETKDGFDNSGNERAEIKRFVLPIEDDDESDDDSFDDETDSEETDDEGVDDTDSEPEDNSEPDSDDDTDSDDDDDPWSDED